MIEEPEDGRRARTARTRASLIDSCRRLMASGDIQPGAATIAESAQCSVRTVFERFDTLPSLYAEAIEDVETSRAVLNHALRENWRTVGVPEHLVSRLAQAIVVGDGKQRHKAKGSSRPHRQRRS